MSRRTIPVTTKRLEEIRKTASDVIQKTAEAVGTLHMIDLYIEEQEISFDSCVLWALRNAIRNIEGATDDAGDISDTIEQFKEIE